MHNEWDPLPWNVIPNADGSSSFASLPVSSPMLRLHQEILQFGLFITPTPAEERYAFLWRCAGVSKC